ncbi:MAG: 16S rRNA (guanine(527)-N(7))-methyltransferase RsmG [Desulfohalobiaceae bacterium]
MPKSQRKEQHHFEPSIQELRQELQNTHLGYQDLHQQCLGPLAFYLSTLLKWNRRFNLVGLKDWKQILHGLIVDSLHLARLLSELEFNSNCLSLDVGAGAGLPGIPLRIYWSQGTYVLLEPRQKKAIFMQDVLGRLELKRTQVQSCRLQELQPDVYRADLMLSRALSAWPEFLRLCQPFLKPQGLALVFSSRPWLTTDHPPAGWELSRESEYTLSTGTKRYFWLFSPNRACS